MSSFSLHLQGCQWEIELYPFPKIPCFLSKITLFSDPKCTKTRVFFQLIIIQFWNGHFKKNLSSQCNVYASWCFFYWYALKSVTLHSKAHQKSSKCLSFPRVWRSHFKGGPVEKSPFSCLKQLLWQYASTPGSFFRQKYMQLS